MSRNEVKYHEKTLSGDHYANARSKGKRLRAFEGLFR